MHIYIVFETISFFSTSKFKILGAFISEAKAQEFIRNRNFGKHLEIQQTTLDQYFPVINSAIDYIT